MGRDRNQWTDADMRSLVNAARGFAQGHPHKAVRMFVFRLCKGLERMLNERARRAEGRAEMTLP